MINGAFVFSMLKGTQRCILDHVLILLFQLTIQKKKNQPAGCFPLFLFECPADRSDRGQQCNIQFIAYSQGACYFFLKQRN